MGKVKSVSAGVLLLAVGAAGLGLMSGARADSMVAQCVDKSGDLAITAANRDFCRCLGLVRDTKTKRFRITTNNAEDRCTGDATVTGSIPKKKAEGGGEPDQAAAPPDAPGVAAPAGVGEAPAAAVGEAPATVGETETRPGFGHGDTNHVHTGPPGLADTGGVPPGLADTGGTPPGLADKGGSPPGQQKN